LGFHLWQDQVLNRQLSPEFSTQRLERFEPDLRLNADPSNTWDPLTFIDDPSQPRNVLSLWSMGSSIYMLGNRDTGKPFQVEVHWRGGASHQDVQNLVLKNTGMGTRPNLYGTDPGGMVFQRGRTHSFAVKANRGWMLSGPGRTGLKVTNRSHSPVLLRMPSGQMTIDSSKGQNFDKSIMWIWMMALIQIIAIALPEEYFFRGFVQPTLARHMGSFRVPLLKIEISWAIILAAALFALVHLVVIPAPFRLAVFFPGIIFGLMYERSGSLAQPILFHAGSNIFLALCNGIWGLSG
jgi:membrane protease YdiL (CAAX protease family)